MAVTVEGVFLLVDRASDALRRIERQAERTDKALRGTGDSMDKISEPKQIRNMERMDRQMRNMERDSGKLETSFKRTERSGSLLDSRLVSIGAKLAALSRIMALMKFPVLVAGIGLAAQGIGALGGAVTALLPGLGEMSGVLAALPATMIGVAGAAITTKFALGGVSEALGGNKEAMKELTPQAREFVRTLKDLDPLVRRLRSAAQRGLLPGLTQAVGTLAERGAPTAQRLLGRFGRTAGRAAERGAERMTRPGVLRDVELLGGQGDRIFGRMTRGALNLADAIRNIAVAARPFTEWLSRTVLQWTQMLRETTKVGRETGTLAEFFERARDRLDQVFRIAGNLWRTFGAILRAARPLSDFIFDFFEGATEKWEEFTNSNKGQQRMRRWFNAIRPPLKQFFGLVGDLSEAWFRLTERGGGKEGALTKTLEKLRGIVKPVERLLGNAADALGPSFIDALTEFVKLLNNIPFTPMKIFLEGMATTLRVLNKAIETVPGLGTGISVLLGAKAVTSAMGGGGGGLGGSRVAISVGELLQKFGGGRLGGLASKAGRGISKLAAVPVWVVNSGGLGDGGGDGKSKGAWDKVKDLATKAAQGALGAGAIKYGRAALTAARIGGGPVLAATALATLYANVNKDLPTGRGAAVRRQARGTVTPGVGLPGAEVDPLGPGPGVGVSRGMAMRPGETAYTRARGMGASAAVLMKDESATATAVSRGHQRQARAHRNLRDEMDKTKKKSAEMNEDIRTKTERATTRAGEKFEDLKRKFNRETQDMKRVTSSGFRSIYEEMSKYLRRIGSGGGGPGTGVTPGPPGQGPRPGAKGVRVPGFGLRDTVPVAPGAIAAPGELIVNRHTESDHDRDAQRAGLPTLAQRVRQESRPHSAPLERAMHGRWARHHARGGRVGYQRGGIVPIPGMPGESIHSSILGDVQRIISRYKVQVTDGYAPTGHAASGEHPLGLAVDLVPGAGGSWDLVDSLAHWAEPSQNQPRAPFRWVGYDGDANHGRGNHLHLSWQHSGGQMGALGSIAGLGPTPRVKMPRAYGGGRGMRGQMSRTALRRMRRRAQRRVNEAYGGGMGGAGDLGAGVTGNNQQMARQMMRRLGWGGDQWPALKELWTRESGWSESARNPSSGAYGIPQSLPASKMGAAAQGTGPAAARAQIAWGLNYIKGRYGSPSAALSFHDSHNWYAQGGRVGGSTLTVGDSLGVGTNPYLQDILRGGITSDATVGRSSASGIGAMRGLMSQGDYSRILLDLGTNDASAGQLRSSIRQARRMAGGTPIYVPTVHGPAAAQKNAMLQRMDRRGLINVIDWAGQSGGLLAGDQIHATGEGYQQRARMIADSFGAMAGGGRIPWFGTGGDFVARRPMVIGVGDSPGGERVQVTPAGRGGRGGGPLIGTMHINNKQPGDVRNQIVREVRGALRTVRRELDQAGVEDGDLA